MPSSKKRSTMSKEILSLTEKDPKFKLARTNLQQDNTEFKCTSQLKPVSSCSKQRKQNESDTNDTYKSSDNRIINIHELNNALALSTQCSQCKCYGLNLQEAKHIGVAQTYRVDCVHCASKKDSDEIQSNNKCIVQPLLRNVITNRFNHFMNYATNVQLLLSSMYLGQSGASAAFVAASLDLPNADRISQHYYRNIDTLSMAIIKVSNELKEKAKKDEIVATYLKQKKGIESNVFENDGSINTCLPNISLDVAYNMG